MEFGRSEGRTWLGKGDATEGQRPWEPQGWVWRLASTALAVAWMGFIFYLSSLPPADLPRQIEAFAWLDELRPVAGHLVLYGVLGPLLLVSLWSWVTGSAYRLRWPLIAISFGTLYGVMDEYHQSFVPGRSPSAFDVFIDGVGVVASVASLWYVVGAVRHRRAQG